MSLEDVYVHDDWEERARRQQRSDQTRWRMALTTVALSLLMALFIRNMPFWQDVRWFLADGAAYALYLTVGAWAIAGPSRGRTRLLSCLYVVVIASVLLGAVATRQAASSEGAYRLACLTVVGTALTIPGWSILGWVILKHPGEIVSHGVSGLWWASRVLYGLLGGSFIVLQLFLSFSFSGLPMFQFRPPMPLLFQQLAYTLGLRSLGEELLFRGILFRYLYRRRGKGFWSATLITLVLNLAIYAVQMPPTDYPAFVALFLLGPSVMVITNSALYASEGSLISPSISNAVFQVTSFAMGFR